LNPNRIRLARSRLMEYGDLSPLSVNGW
jgi:hypothetical protein